MLSACLSPNRLSQRPLNHAMALRPLVRPSRPCRGTASPPAPSRTTTVSTKSPWLRSVGNSQSQQCDQKNTPPISQTLRDDDFLLTGLFGSGKSQENLKVKSNHYSHRKCRKRSPKFAKNQLYKFFSGQQFNVFLNTSQEVIAIKVSACYTSFLWGCDCVSLPLCSAGASAGEAQGDVPEDAGPVAAG